VRQPFTSLGQTCRTTISPSPAFSTNPSKVTLLLWHIYAQLIAPDLVLLHSVNTLLSSVSLPTLHNVLDATPYLLILLYEALPPSLVPFQKRKCIPFVERSEPNACFGSRFKNLKLLIGSIACDPELGLSRRTKRSLADLDLAGFCEKDVDAARGLLGMFVEVVKSAGLDGGGVAGDSQSEGELEGSVSTVGERRTSSGVVPKPPRFGRRMMLRSGSSSAEIDALPPALRPPSLRSNRFLGVDDKDGEYGRAESPYQNENFWPLSPLSSIRATASRTVPEEKLPYLLQLPSSRASTSAKIEAALLEDDSADDSDISLIPLPPSPPTHAQYLALKESFLPSLPSHTGSSGKRPLLAKGSRAASEASFSSIIHPQEPHAIPLPVNTNSYNQIGEACPDRGEERSDDERTSLISVSPASWGADSFYTTNLRKKRAEALERLHRAEERFEQEISAVNLGMQRITETERPFEEVEDEGYVEKETMHLPAMPISYDDFIAEEDLHQFEQDGTVAAEMLEGLVRKLLVRRGYKILE